jgi:hypothetical protein
MNHSCRTTISPKKATFDRHGDEQCHSEQGWTGTTTERSGYMLARRELQKLE